MQLKATVKETWASIPPQQCHKLITSMPCQIETEQFGDDPFLFQHDCTPVHKASTFRMVSSLNHAFIVIVFLFLNIELCVCACARAEYEINGECCPMCPSGSRVFRHCTEVSSTTCKQCVGSTYTDEPNGLPMCISCTVCEAGQGLRVKTACTQNSDTVCEPLEGFYCTDGYQGSCRYAVEHRKCSPGQHIKQKGTALKDTECAACADGTYSNGSLEMCKPHSNTFRMVSSLNHAFIVIIFLFLNTELCVCACARAEYEINGECCPMCPSGSRVFRHCTEVTSTTCKQCVGSTYTDEPNGLPMCISCTVCEAGQGLRVKTACTQNSDTVCEPLEGFYCTDGYRGGCRYAVEHRKCSPGEYIKQKGTALKDTECAACADGTYSNGSLEMCKPHSKCEDLGLIEIKPETNSLDAECGKKPPVALIAGVLTTVLAVAGALFFVIRCRCTHREWMHVPLITLVMWLLQLKMTVKNNFVTHRKMSSHKHCGYDVNTFRMVSSLNHAFIINSVLLLNIELCICACARAEYEINGECCPMCPSGSRVFRHCTEVTSTTCKQCVDSTYTDEPNGLLSCISCTVCDAGQGLRVKTACTWTSDTVCEPLEGFYCTDGYRGGCRYAVEHRKCSPGQYIKQKGTALKDTECAVCVDGTYSNGSLHICKQHSKRKKNMSPKHRMEMCAFNHTGHVASPVEDARGKHFRDPHEIPCTGSGVT
ncbi:hypothetical protein QTP70_030963 [Hemibagrus guttatus]|uniref:TNFR-Cys domain-containing protein n=1 Tax=Hemibagrus guttatus TaxID=175788 RepID=A0AAE0R349_9TELE|nr:hypothetical protein QTP70_030963 [Hemibagrus guttatus]